MAGSKVGRDAIDVCGVEGCRRLDGRRGKAPETNKKERLHGSPRKGGAILKLVYLHDIRRTPAS